MAIDQADYFTKRQVKTQKPSQMILANDLHDIRKTNTHTHTHTHKERAFSALLSKIELTSTSVTEQKMVFVLTLSSNAHQRLPEASLDLD